MTVVSNGVPWWELMPNFLRRYLVSPRFVLCVIGINVSFLVYGLIQERLMTQPYVEWDKPDVAGEFFGSSFLLVCANRLVAGMLAGTMILLNGDMSGFRIKAPLYKYMAVSLSNVIATSCQYEALKWVTFPTQTLAKSAKALPVMIWGSLIAGKVYGVLDYFTAIAVGLGCTIFMVFGNIASKTASGSDGLFGLVLMAVYLFFDGFTSTFQEKLFAGYSMTVHNQMMYVSFSSACLSMLLAFASGTAFESFDMLRRFPQLVSDMTVLSMAAASGQLAISYTIKNFGALMYATIMTVRQFFSVFVSNIVFHHHMNIFQWAGASIVFAALLAKSLVKSHSKVAPGSNVEAAILPPRRPEAPDLSALETVETSSEENVDLPEGKPGFVGGSAIA